MDGWKEYEMQSCQGGQIGVTDNQDPPPSYRQNPNQSLAQDQQPVALPPGPNAHGRQYPEIVLMRRYGWMIPGASLSIVFVVVMAIVLSRRCGLLGHRTQHHIRELNLAGQFSHQYTPGRGPIPEMQHTSTKSIKNSFTVAKRLTQPEFHHSVMQSAPSLVPGLYLLPALVTSIDPPKNQENAHPPVSSVGTTDRSQSRHHHSAGFDHQGKDETGGHDSVAILKRSPYHGEPSATSFTRWGVEVLYALDRRSMQGVRTLMKSYIGNTARLHKRSEGARSLQIEKGWCIDNTCSANETLNKMCNWTKSEDRFKRKECDWCWPVKDHIAIDEHCERVSHQAAMAISIVLGLLLTSLLAITIMLVIRKLLHRHKTREDSKLQKRKLSVSPLQDSDEATKGFQSLQHKSNWGSRFKAAETRYDDTEGAQHEPTRAIGRNHWYQLIFPKSRKASGGDGAVPDTSPSCSKRVKMEALKAKDADGQIPVLPPAIGPPVFSSIENVGQGTLSSHRRHNHQDDLLTPVSTSLGRPRANSSDSQRKSRYQKPTFRRACGT